MRKLVHEEIDREIADKSVHLAYRFVGKPTAKAFLKALSIFPGMPAKAVGKKIVHGIGQKIHPTEGKQSIKTLIRQGQGVSSIPLADEGMKDFQQLLSGMLQDGVLSTRQYAVAMKNYAEKGIIDLGMTDKDIDELDDKMIEEMEDIDLGNDKEENFSGIKTK